MIYIREHNFCSTLLVNGTPSGKPETLSCLYLFERSCYCGLVLALRMVDQTDYHSVYSASLMYWMNLAIVL